MGFYRYMYEATYSGSEESDQWATPDNKGIYTPHIKNHLDKNLEDSNEIGYVPPPWQMIFQTIIY